MGIEGVNFNIQSFSDDNHVIENLGIDNIAQISKDAAIAKANADRDVTIAKSAAEEAANRSRVDANQKIIEQNTMLSLKESELKQQTDTAKAQADANKLLESSLTDEVLAQKFIEKWNGQLPTTYAGDDILKMFNLR